MARPKPLQDQIAIVTGGGRGLGRAYAEALAAAGAKVAVVSRTESEVSETAQLIERAGGTTHALPADVTDRAAMERVVETVERTLGPVDILVNAAGTVDPTGPIAEVDPDDWWQGVAVNVKGTFLITRLVLPGMIARGRGRIVNLSSGIGTSAYAYLSAYSVGKTAVIRLTESIAAEIEGTGVSIFSITPGMVKTTMIDSLAEHPKAKEWFPWTLANLAGGGVRKAEESARLILRLVSGEADVLSGRHISVTHDLDMLIQRADEAKDRRALLLRLVGFN